MLVKLTTVNKNRGSTRVRTKGSAWWLFQFLFVGGIMRICRAEEHEQRSPQGWYALAASTDRARLRIHAKEPPVVRFQGHLTSEIQLDLCKHPA